MEVCRRIEQETGLRALPGDQVAELDAAYGLKKVHGERAAITGVLAGAIVMLFVKLETKIPFTWWVLIGSTVTFGTGYLASFILTENERHV